MVSKQTKLSEVMALVRRRAATSTAVRVRAGIVKPALVKRRQSKTQSQSQPPATQSASSVEVTVASHSQRVCDLIDSLSKGEFLWAAVCWVTSLDILRSLQCAVVRGVDIQIVVSNEPWMSSRGKPNGHQKKVKKLYESLGKRYVGLTHKSRRKVALASRVRVYGAPSSPKRCHHKATVVGTIDSETNAYQPRRLMIGSYNWTQACESLESFVLLNDPAAAQQMYCNLLPIVGASRNIHDM